MARMKAFEKTLQQNRFETRNAEVSADVEENLRALGYLE
jgi:hypothetical protein